MKYLLTGVILGAVGYGVFWWWQKNESKKDDQKLTAVQHQEGGNSIFNEPNMEQYSTPGGTTTTFA